MPYPKKKKKKRNWYNYLPYIFLVALVANGVLIFMRVSPALNSEKSHQASAKRVSVTLGGKEYDNAELSDEKYRELALEMDRQLVEDLRNKKSWRRRDIANEANDPNLFHDSRIKDLEFELEEHFDAKSISVEGSIGYELQQTIERMKDDSPLQQ